VERLAQEHHGRPEHVDIEHVQGTFRLLYATRNAGIMGTMQPGTPCTCLEALAELFAAALPHCRDWTEDEWRQRRLVRMLCSHQGYALLCCMQGR
jgi:hypothetical protein